MNLESMSSMSNVDAPSVLPQDGRPNGTAVAGENQGVAALRAMEGLGFVMDVPVELTVELGRKHVRIGEVLRMGPGSVLELTKANGDPLDIYVNNRLIARGEAVVVGERYGVRLTEVMVGDSGLRGGQEP
jgi:flagellar motor switch protein FliN